VKYRGKKEEKVVKMGLFKNYCYLSGIALLCLYYLPFLILGDDSYLIIHDNLDQNMYEFTALKRMYAPYYQNGQFIQIMNGLPDYMLPISKWNITGLLFLLFNPFFAYIVNDLLARIIGFLGMMLLLDKCILNPDLKYRNIVIFFISITFSLLGCYTIYRCFSIMGQPFLIFAFWNLYKGNIKWQYYLIIAIFVFGSSMIISGIFIGTSLTVVWLFCAIKNRRMHFPFLYGIILLAVGYLITEYAMILSLFDNSAMTSHRVEFQPELSSIFHQIVNIFQNGALITQYHTGQFWTAFIILPLVYIYFSKKMTRLVRHLVWIIIGILLILFLYPHITLWLGEKIVLIKAFAWNRFYMLLPVLWLLLFAIILEILLKNTSKLHLFFSMFLVVGLCLNVMSHNRELRWNMKCLTGIKPDIPSFYDFYDTKLFSNIKTHIGKPTETYRVVSLGIFPSVANYNDFFCLDGYMNLYPLKYKHLFREIIAPELDKSIELKKYFDFWGSRCYLFSAELDGKYLWSKVQNKKVFDLNINIKSLKQLSQKETYIISAVEIINYKSLELILENVFEGNYWKIYLYRIQ
jgi:hypothetical protein